MLHGLISLKIPKRFLGRQSSKRPQDGTESVIINLVKQNLKITLYKQCNITITYNKEKTKIDRKRKANTAKIVAYATGNRSSVYCRLFEK